MQFGGGSFDMFMLELGRHTLHMQVHIDSIVYVRSYYLHLDKLDEK